MSHSSRSIFADPHGRRRRFLQAVAIFSFIIFLGAATYLISSLLVAPKLNLPENVLVYRAQLKAKAPAPLSLLEMKDDWRHLVQGVVPLPFPNSTFLTQAPAINIESHTPSIFSQRFPIRLGYVAPWNPFSELSLRYHTPLLTHVTTDWFTITGVEGKLIEQPSETTRLFCARKGLGFLPILSNLDGDVWQPEAVEGLLRAPQEEQNNFIAHLLQVLPASSLGLLLEWDEIDPSYRQEMTRFLVHLAEQLQQEHRELWITIPLGKASAVFDIEAISSVAEHLVTPLYDEHSAPDDAGPLSEMEWFQDSLKTVMSSGKPNQWIIGLGTYAYDWNLTHETMESLSFTDVMARADLSTPTHVAVEAPYFSPHFTYLAGANSKEEHEIWFLDAVTFFNQLQLLTPYHLGGVALYRLGEEDPDVWKALQLQLQMDQEHRTQLTTEEVESFEKIHFKNEIASIGSGDFLSVGDKASNGWRSVSLENNNLLEAVYQEFPRPECIYRQGAPGPHEVALTFDDGPDPTWTPRILKILKEKQTPATFFVLGSQVQQFPDLLQRIQSDGHEIGNHTYTHQNLGEANEEQICLELNATTRLIESITGHSTALFRPPYNGDANPTTPGELQALRIASDLGYLTVGESIDPNDWALPGVYAIVEQVKEQRAQGGSVILLHDAGGNRAQTVAALPQIIDYLHARGDTIVPLSTFIGLSKDILMPPLHQADVTVAMHYIYGSFEILRFLEATGWALLVIATILSLACILFFLFCALRHRAAEAAQKSHHDDNFSQPLPSLSVIIAAYNESRVIGSTIEHLLASHYAAPIELLIVDDGSVDNTVEVVTQYLKKLENEKRITPHIRLLQQSNTGKATALNHAIKAAQYELIVTLDADTMVTPEALSALIFPFQDPHVGAVSGYIRVGNFRHWLGRFQQIEYEFAFEINRRAQDFLQCITVVPGALSAFRRTALFEAGLLNTDTLAEDTDLTLQLQCLGWKVTYAPLALADTEAPGNIKSLFSQRFRWAFGTLQCLWKHRALTFRADSGWLGCFALPSIWVFQLGIIALTPLLDIMVLLSLFFGRGKAIWPYFLASLILDIGLSALSAHLAKRSAWSSWRAVPMRFLYRPLLGYVVWKCLFKAAAGSWVRWSKLERTAAAIHQKEREINFSIKNSQTNSYENNKKTDLS